MICRSLNYLFIWKNRRYIIVYNYPLISPIETSSTAVLTNRLLVWLLSLD
uniref:Uncharacterized protein n=1 Tax=Arundo donax TaxID=35708 RepID=A0A0A9EED1_ARUDO